MVNETILTFETETDPPGLRVLDQVEQLQYQLFTPERLSPTPVDAGSFQFPVGSGLQIETEEISVHSGVAVTVRDAEGEMLTQVEQFEPESFGEGKYIIGLSAQVQTYLEVSGPFEIQPRMVQTHCVFDGPTAVDVGFRSRHTQPATTITTTEDPVDMMAAIGTFGSALKSTSPERSFPLNRGHPPQVELGESLDIPTGIDPPDTGISIEVPPIRDVIYPVATLAYYLGAELVPGQTPRLVTNNGFEHSFDYPQGFESDVEQRLKQLFLLDCVARTEGEYRIEMHERTVLDRRLDLDWSALYEQSLARRLESYLSVPYELVKDQVPEWRLTVHVEPTAETVRQLPFAVDDLAVVRTAHGPTTTVPSTGPTGEPTRGARTDDVLTRSGSVGSRATTGRDEETSFVEPERTDSLEQAWIGDDIPIGASKLVAEAFENRLDREVTEGDISISIVVNDSRMSKERELVDQAYGDRENLPFDVSVRSGLTTVELRETLREDRNFLHYIGHIDEAGFECVDGRLDVATLEQTGIDAFLLNACNSYQQGLSLVRAGAIGGIVTLAEIVNDRAVGIGETIARLLNTGFPLRAALTIARAEHVLGGQYIVVGDGGMTVSQSRSQTPTLLEITPLDDCFEVTIQTSVTDTMALGAVYVPYIGDNNTYYLSSGTIDTFRVSGDELTEFLDLENVPVKLEDGSMCWSYDLSL
jgi:hypothetical protein